MKHYITPEEHARMQRRRGRQALGLLVAILVIVGFVTVLRAGVGAVANLFDDTAQKQEYEDKLEGLVLFDPMPFDGIENIDDLTLREAAVWGCIYNIQETQGGFDNYNTDPDTEQLLLPSLDVDAYLAKLLGPGFKLTHRSFEMEDMTIEFDDATQCYKIPVTGTVGYYRAVVTKLFKRSGKLHVTVGYIPTASTDDSIINVSSDTPTKYMDYLFERQSGSWYLTGLTESETKAESTESTPAANVPEPMCRMLFLQQPVRILLRLRQTAPLQTRAWIHRRRNSPPTAPRHRRTKAQPARRHNTKQKYRIQGRCFVSGIFYLRSNFTITSRYHRYGTMFQIIHSSIRM